MNILKGNIRQCFIALVLMVQMLPLSAQNVVLSGQVTDAQTGEPLIGVTVYNTDRRTGTTTNTTGRYTITLPSGRPLELVFSYVGYASETQNLTLSRNTKLDIQLRQDTQNLREVQVFGSRHNFGVQSSQMSAIAVDAEQVRRMPALMGEPDVLKTLQRLPGVQSTSDGKAGIHVRGGETDENLLSIDGITLYNSEHLQGFVSAINAEMLDDVVLYKGAFPARYGTRLSSVVDVNLEEGDFEKTRASITTGLLASRLHVDGPIWKGHTSYNVAARASYFSAIVKPLLEEVIYDNPGQMNDYSHMRYWDLNVKLTHRFTDLSTLSAVFYTGNDVNNANPNETDQHFEYDKWVKQEDGSVESEARAYTDNYKHNQTRNRWNNLLGGLNYTLQFSPFFYLNTALTYSSYDYRLDYNSRLGSESSIDIWDHGQIGAELFSRTRSTGATSFHSKVQDLGARGELVYSLKDRYEIRGGIQFGNVDVTPSVFTTYSSYRKYALNEDIVWNVGLGEERYRENEVYRENRLDKKHTLKSIAAFVENDWDITPWLKSNIGLRLQGYALKGKSFVALEPRISIRAMIASRASVKASYSRMSQALHILSSGSLVTPSEIWVPIGKGMKLGRSDQVSVGYGIEFPSGIQISVESYYKWLDNVVEYKEGASFMSATSWEQLMAQGKGRAYGVELLLQKTVGNTTGMVSYTWSKSLRTFDREGMVLNGGREFYAAGDRRHNISLSFSQRISKNWDLHAAWTYQTGRRASMATTTMSGSVLDEFNNYYPETSDNFQIDYEKNPSFDDITGTYYMTSSIEHLVRMNTFRQRNSYVLPAIHRLDVSLSHHGSVGIGEMICDIGIYNIYNQQNVSSVYWGYRNNRPALKGVCMFPIMPSISLTLKL